MVTQDELMYLQSQLEGLESIFLELMPAGVELKRQQVQDFYDKRLDAARDPVTSVAPTELRRQFNTKANQVRNLVDSAESLGDASNKINLIRAASSLPEERSRGVMEIVMQFCKELIYENHANAKLMDSILQSGEIRPVEARMLLAASMFVIVYEVESEGQKVPLKDVLAQYIGLVKAERLLARNDPFLLEAQCALEALDLEEAEMQI